MENLHNSINKVRRSFTRTTISLPPDQKEFMEENNISPSEIIQDHVKGLQSGNVGLWRQLQEMAKLKEALRMRVASLFKFLDAKDLVDVYAQWEKDNV